MGQVRRETLQMHDAGLDCGIGKGRRDGVRRALEAVHDGDEDEDEDEDVLNPASWVRPAQHR